VAKNGMKGRPAGPTAFIAQTQQRIAVERHAEMFRHAVTYHNAGQLKKAEAVCQEILAEDPRHTNANHMLGVMEHRAGRSAHGAELIARATRANPNVAQYHSDLGAALRSDGRAGEAIASFRAAISLKPDFAPAHGNLGNALAADGRLEEAVACYRKSLELNPGGISVLHNLATALKDLGELQEALECYERVLALKPEHFKAHSNLGTVYAALGRKDEAAAQFRLAFANNPDFLTVYQGLLFDQNYVAESDPHELLAAAQQFAESISAKVALTTSHGNNADPDRPLRVGLVSGDLGNHVVGRFLEGPLREIDPEKIRLFAYMTSKVDDGMTANFKQIIPEWRLATAMNDAELASAIAADEIDILVDLAGYTGFNRLPVFARKPAPVQVSWLGYSGTTGFSTIDYILGDRWVIPEGEQDQFAEMPWRMPDSYLCYTPNSGLGEVAPPPALSAGHVTFGCFNNLSKVSSATVRCWAKVLHAVPNSRLTLRYAPEQQSRVAERIAETFAGLGIGGDRLEFSPRTDDFAKHMNGFGKIDIALDPFPYVGTTTTCDTLSMGVPVLTLKGDRFIAHVGESILHNVGLEDWIAASPDEYVAKAVAFAADLQGLATLRATLRQRFFASPVCDAPRFARNLEVAFAGMWRAWCERQRAERPA
jgi:protein O-GlcNAc transferase